MEERIDKIIKGLKALDIGVEEDIFKDDLDLIANTISDMFWDEMYHSDDYDDAETVAKEAFTEAFEDLPYISPRLEDSEWIETKECPNSEEYITFKDLVFEEVMERGNIPTNEDETKEQMDEDGVEKYDDDISEYSEDDEY